MRSPASSRDQLVSAFLPDQVALRDDLRVTIGTKVEQYDDDARSRAAGLSARRRMLYEDPTGISTFRVPFAPWYFLARTIHAAIRGYPGQTVTLDPAGGG